MIVVKWFMLHAQQLSALSTFSQIHGQPKLTPERKIKERLVVNMKQYHTVALMLKYSL